jgi:hypothetical protein
MRKVVIFIILGSMILHCASRVGLLSYLYQNRNEIAFTLGLTDEIPIAMCNSDYDFDKGLTIQSADHDETSQRTFPVAFEIKLFFDSDRTQIPDRTQTSLHTGYIPAVNRLLQGCPHSVFRPPVSQV